MIGDVDVVAARGGDRGGDPEVGHHRLTLLQQDVLRLDVAVDHPVAMGIGQRAGHGAGDPKRLLHRQRPLGEPGPERLTPGVRHHEEEMAVALARVVQRENLGMGQPRRDADLPEKPPRLIAPARFRTEYLERHLAAVLEVLGEIHAGRAAAADLLLQPVTAGQSRGGGVEKVGEVGHDGKIAALRGSPGSGPLGPSLTVGSHEGAIVGCVGKVGTSLPPYGWRAHGHQEELPAVTPAVQQGRQQVGEKRHAPAQEGHPQTG
jgi:hypothetical protein